MGECCARFVVGMVTVMLLIGLGGLAAGGAASYWFKIDHLGIKTNIGLWRYCRKFDDPLIPNICANRDNILQFKEDEEHALSGPEARYYDLVLVFIIGSGAVAILGFITSLAMCCVGNQVSTWRCVATALIIFTMIAAGLAVTAIVLSEVLIKGEISDSQKNLIEYGWSAILAWVGAGALILSFVLSLVTCCATPSNDSYGESHKTAAYDNGFSYTPNHRIQSQQSYNAMPHGGGNSLNSRRSSAPIAPHHGMENAGYQMR